jgi:single-stranded-DNA-specific exonuclease
MEIKNLKETAQKIQEAINSKKKIVLYGDADLDGVTSVIILKETIESLGGKIEAIYFPDREEEGYGISKKALEILKKHSPGLFIALDCGISNFEEVKQAKNLGFEVIIVDHHEILDKLPEADIIVDPKQPGDDFHFKELATVGIAFKLSEELLKEKMRPSLRQSFLELTAIATIADMMPQEKENKIFIETGLSSLERSWRPGICAFLKDEMLKNLSLSQKISKIISILNVRDVENNLPASFRLLTASSEEEAKKIIKVLKTKLKERREKILAIEEEVSERISPSDPIIFEGDESFDLSLLSSVASHFCQKYKKPVFLFKKMEKESHGTVRAPPSVNSVELMKKCKEYLISFGGHPQASGFRIKNENLEKFKKCLIENYEKSYNLH